MADGLFAFHLEAGRGFPPETLRAFAEHSDDVESYATLPSVIFATTTLPHAEMIAALPGITAFRPAKSESRNLVHSVHHQLMIAAVHERTLAPNGVAKAVPLDALVDGLPRYPTLTLDGGTPTWGVDPAIRLDTRYCYVGALNISLEFRRRVPYDPYDPVNLALSDASRHLPVALAAGNVNGDPDPRIFAWPLNPDVIAVGATNPQGTELLDCSRVGDPGAGIPGPDVVANGIDETGEPGTSYAAPVVSMQLAQLAAALMAVRAAVLASTDAPEGIPLAGRCFVDIDRAVHAGHAGKVTDFRPRRRPLPALPFGVVPDLAAHAVATQPAARGLRGRPGTPVLRQALLASARPVPGHEPRLVGAGVVSDASTLDYLTGLDVRQLLTLYGVPAAGSSDPVFDADLLPAFLEGARDSMLGWSNGIADFTDEGGTIFVEAGPRG
jgi:hypothetical protein